MLNYRHSSPRARQAGSLDVMPSAFGLNMLHWPVVPHAASSMRGSVYRLHDYSGGDALWRTRWQKMEPAKGVYDWGSLDAAVEGIRVAGGEVLFTVFGTPAWASARPSESSAYGPSNLGIAAEPSSVSDLGDFCTALATRYAGRIRYYEIWNEVNVTGFFSGTQAKLSEMVRVASTAIRAADPAAVIVGPSVTTLWPSGNGRSYMASMYGAPDGFGGSLSDHIDIVAVHLYAPTFARLPEVPVMVKAVRDIMSVAKISNKPLWNTEHTILSPEFSTLLGAERAVAIRKMMLMPIASAFGGCAVSILYAPDSGEFSFTPEDVAIYNAMATEIMSREVSDVRITPDGRVSYTSSKALKFIA